MGGYPITGLGGGYPIPGLDGGVPHPRSGQGGTLGTPPARSGRWGRTWGTPQPGLDGWGQFHTVKAHKSNELSNIYFDISEAEYSYMNIQSLAKYPINYTAFV